MSNHALCSSIPSSIQILIYSYCMPHELFCLGTANKYLLNVIKQEKSVWKYIIYLPHCYTNKNEDKFIKLFNNHKTLDRGLRHLYSLQISWISSIDVLKYFSLFPNLTALQLNFSNSSESTEARMCQILESNSQLMK